MSNTRYIEFDSQYRNRNEWPKPAEFEIPISQSGTRDRFNALDPVSDAAIMVHQPVSFVNSISGNFMLEGSVSINSAYSVTQTSDPNQIVIKTDLISNSVQREDNFYAGSVIEAGGLAVVQPLSVAVGYDGTNTNNILTSTDGTTWTGVNCSTTLNILARGIHWNGQIWVAVGNGTYRIATSSNGTVWTGVSCTTGLTINGNSVYWNGYMWVAVGGGTNTIVTSTDGTVWTGVSCTTGITSNGNSVCWNGYMWVAVGQGTNNIVTSTDGTVWTGVSCTTGITNYGNCVCWNGQIWIAGGEGTNNLVTSSDGFTWVGSNISTLQSVQGIAWNGSMFVAVGYSIAPLNSKISTSTDGINWIPQTSISSYLLGVSWTGNNWIAVGEGISPSPKNILSSLDGITWTSINSANTEYLYNVASNNINISTPLTPVQRRRISNSKFLYNDGIYDYILFSLQNPFSDAVVDGVGISISNPSTPTDTEFPLLYIPTGENSNNYYVNCIVQRVPNSLDPSFVETRTIVGYNGPTKLGYDGLTRLAQLDLPFSNFLSTDSIIIRRKPASESGTTQSGTSTTTFVLDTIASSEPNFYVGSFIRFPGSLSPIPTTTTNGNQTRKIVKYDSTSKRVTVSPGFSSIPGTDIYEILPFTRDNANPFVYTGSMVSQQEMVCYEIKLVNLILPNRILSVGKGSLITFYPYVYVQLSNVSTPGAGNKNIIYSNNPNSTKALFRAAITDVPNLTSSTFIKIDGDGTVQTVKFKPNDNLYFCVTLPSGEVFETILPEFESPRIPNVLSQVSAMFAIRRV